MFQGCSKIGWFLVSPTSIVKGSLAAPCSGHSSMLTMLIQQGPDCPGTWRHKARQDLQILTGNASIPPHQNHSNLIRESMRSHSNLYHFSFGQVGQCTQLDRISKPGGRKSHLSQPLPKQIPFNLLVNPLYNFTLVLNFVKIPLQSSFS